MSCPVCGEDDVTDLQPLMEFKDKVSLMRRYQKQYFKERKKEDLIESKRLEAQVDQFLVGLS